MKKKVLIIGSGIGGLATACLLGKKGYDVTIYEKNLLPGGRANIFSEKGFVFDMGPSWYMMPDVFEEFFSLLGENINDYMKLERLSPSYRVFLKSSKQTYDFYSDLEKNKKLFESIEKGAGKKLEDYLETCKYQYEIAKREFMYKNFDSFFDLFNRRVMTEGRKLPIFKKMNQIIESQFKSELLQKVLQYQTVLLGTAPTDTPGIYALMNHVDFDLGVWYPRGGIYEIVKSIVAIAKKNGITLKTKSPVKKIIVENGKATGIQLESGSIVTADIVISNADYAYTEERLLDTSHRSYPKSYWKKKTLAPSAIILYLGIKGEIPSLTHHNLLFSKDWQHNFTQIFQHPALPDDPSLYICCPSKSDSTVAPKGTENLFVLVPIAARLTYTKKQLDTYEEKILGIMEKEMDIPDLKSRILYKRRYDGSDFIRDYNSYQGSALGLAHTLTQTAFFRPNTVSKKVENLYYVGANTNPGIGMPICLISAQLVYKRLEGITDPSPLTSL